MFVLKKMRLTLEALGVILENQNLKKKSKKLNFNSRAFHGVYGMYTYILNGFRGILTAEYLCGDY